MPYLAAYPCRRVPPLFILAQDNHFSACVLLLEHGGDVDGKYEGQTPLFIAAHNGHARICKLLLLWKASVHFRSSHGGATPLYAAALQNHLGVCELLVKHAEARDVWDALFGAAGAGLAAVCRVMLKHGADVNSSFLDCDETAEETALHRAVGEDHADVCRVLIEHGANVNSTDVDGDAPLHYANSVEVARLLIEHGADVNATNNKGQTPLELEAANEDELCNGEHGELHAYLTSVSQPAAKRARHDQCTPARG